MFHHRISTPTATPSASSSPTKQAAAPEQPPSPANCTHRTPETRTPRTSNLGAHGLTKQPCHKELNLPAPPLQASLTQAAQVCRETYTHVVSFFEAVAHGDPLPVDTAEQAVDTVLQCMVENTDALISLVRLKSHNDYACMHSVAVCALMACLAQHMALGPAAVRQAALAGLLHDIGKAFIAQRLLKKPGRLTSDEYATVSTHPELGYAALRKTTELSHAVQDVALHHHERPDGKGYPHGLAGDQLSLLARMAAVCDVYDAVTSNRPYKDAWDPAETMTHMDEWTKLGQFDAAVMQAFQVSLGQFPIGSLVRLNSNRLGVVSSAANAQALSGASPSPSPSVTAFYCLCTHQLVTPEVVHIGVRGTHDSIQCAESNSMWRFSDLDKLWASQFAQGSLHVQAAHAGFEVFRF
jgi:HD-GYP domain-containing protein (c-di-GMP phosphodiesterase class II)